jgi:Subtilase family
VANVNLSAMPHTTPANPRRRRSHDARLRAPGLAALGSGLLATVASGMSLAQLRLPQLPLQLPAIGVPADLPAATTILDAQLRARVEARQLTARALIRNHRAEIEADPAGSPMLRAELLAFAPDPNTLQRALDMGFEIVRRRALDSLGVELVVLRVPPNLSTRTALDRLQRIDPQGAYDYNHIYLEGGEAALSADGPRTPPKENEVAATRSGNAAEPRIGLVDGGVDLTHPAFTHSLLMQSGCDGQPIPSAHGTAVASLITGNTAEVHGAAPEAALYAVDVYCGRPTGGAVDALADAFATLARQKVSVINVSLVGPRNAVMELLIRRVQAQGILVVAAAGNDGPAAPPLYPAAFPGVIAVTGVDSRQRVLPEAAQGAHIQFAARGAELIAADLQHAYSSVRGTSFAAPIVAGLLGVLITEPGQPGADIAVQKLIEQSIDLGPRGRDPVYGYGLVGVRR